MHCLSRLPAGLAAMLLCAAAAPADFVGASLELVEDDGPGGNWTWRVYADFDDPTNVLLAIGAVLDVAEWHFDADTPLVNDGGVLADTKAEDFPSGDFAGPRDSWVTIGDDLGFPSPTDYSPGFAGSDGKASVILGVTLSETDGGWFNNVPGTPVQGTHILIGQFTVASGSNFTMSGLAIWEPTPSFTLWDPEGGDFITSFFEVAIEPLAMGACCATDGTCTVATVGVCEFEGGVYQGDDTSCDPNPCPQPMGACCFDDGSCTVDEGASCVDAGGVFQGDDTTCVPNPCPQPTGACCRVDGLCAIVSQVECDEVGGTYQGDETSCDPGLCPPAGACCFPDGSCVLLTEAACLAAAGVYEGDETGCFPNPCPPPPVGFAGASLELVEDDGPGGNWTWRVYLEFKGGFEVLLAVGAVPADGELLFQSDTPLINDGGVFAGLKTEDFPSGDFAGPRDSWVTIGDDLGFPSPTDYTPDFAGSDGKSSVILGTSFSETDGGWFNNVPTSPVTGTQILIGQFTVASGSNLSLSGLAFWQESPSFTLWDPDDPEGFLTSFFEVAIEPPATGACCAPDGTCEVATAAGCAFSGGVFQGDGTNCDPNPCPQPMGACCFDDGSCTVDEGVVCVDAGGVFQGDGTTCATVTCPQPGACCLPDGACTQSMVLGGADCAGAYQGDDTTCAMVTCPQPGACCLPDGSCVLSAVVGGGDCEGAYQGDGTECETVECPTPSGFVGASLELVEDDGPGGNWTWRVYADFKGIDDVLLAVGAVPPTGELLFQSDAPLVNDGGVLAGTKDEDFPAEGFSGPRDSWVAIGDDLSFPSPTDYTPDFAGSDGKASVILGTAFSETNGGWFNNVPSTPVQGTHLLIAQFTLPSGSSFSLSGLVFWQNVPSFAVWTPEGEDFIASFFEVSIDPVATGACCLLDGSCSVDSPAACEFFAGTYQGDGTDCDAVECPQPMGACCFDDGSCTIETEDGCLAAGGISAGIGVLCEFGVCPQPGACCFEDGSCTLATGVGGADCVGVYQGDDTRCETAECPQPGACCLPDGSCVQAGVLGGADCEGVYQGDDTVCETVSCPQPGACCLDDGSCVQSAVLGGGDCAGVYQGDDTVCETVSCPQPGACCFPDGSCEQSSVIGGADCAGVYQGDDTDCGTAGVCPQPGACCFDDGSCAQSTVVGGSDCAGVYQGDDTDCGTAGVCPQPGACCFDDGSCAQSTVVGGSDCAGVYQGDDTTCATVQCPQPGACCLPDGSCVQSSVTGGADCAGAYQGDSTLCATVECPQPSGFLGASLELVEDDGPGGDWTWRVFIDFEGPTDVLLAVGSIADAVELRFDSDTPLINDGGVLAGTKAEDFPSGDFAGPRDSWVTIGDDLGFPSPTDYSPGFAGSDGKASVILGTTFSANDGGWFNNVPTTPVQGVHILVAQFTVASGSNFSLYGLAFWQPDPTFTLWDPEGEDFNTSFFEVSIEPPVTGACCTLDGMTCTVETAASCSFLGGIYRGDGTGCDAVECIPSGACCLPDGACVVESVEDCLAAGGVPQGIGLPCADAQCPQPGACCLLDGSCEIVPEVGGADCAGVYLGDNTTCDDGMCPAACVPSPDGDTDGDGFTDFNDLLNVLARWGLCMLPPGFECLGDLDCDGQVDFSDLKVVLAKWNPPGG